MIGPVDSRKEFEMAYHLVFVPEDQEAIVESFENKSDLAKKLRTLVRRDGCAYIYCGERLLISRDKETKQYFILEEGHIPMPVLVSGRTEVLPEGRLGSAREPDPAYLAATKSADLQGARPTGPGTSAKKARPTAPRDVEKHDEDKDDDEDDGDDDEL
jgi:hypothetical protein